MPHTTAVHAAARSGDNAALAAALQRHTEHLNARTDEGWVSGITPLHLAAAAGHKGSMEMLLSHGADIDAVDSWGRTPLCYAIKHQQKSCATTLLDSGASIAGPPETFAHRTALHCAAQCQTADMLRLLLRKGADIGAADRWGRTALMFAANWASEACVQVLLSKGANVQSADRHGWTALHLAALYGPSCLPALLAAGSDTEAADDKGRTPLLLAANFCQLVSMHALLEAGASTEAAEGNGCTALMLAAGAADQWRFRPIDQEFLRCVHLLLQHGANVAATDAAGWAALHWAARRGSAGIIEALAAARADLAARNNEGHTARQVAAQAGKVDAAQRLWQLELKRGTAVEEAAGAGWATAAGAATAGAAKASKGHMAGAGPAVAESAGAGPAVAAKTGAGTAAAGAAGMLPAWSSWGGSSCHCHAWPGCWG